MQIEINALHNPSKKMGCVYLIENLEENIVYVGKTTVDIKLRLARHIVDSFNPAYLNGNYDFYTWINSMYINYKFPLIKIIEKCSVDELSQKEVYWINYYKKISKIYNIKHTDKDTLHRYIKKRPVDLYDLSGNFVQSFETLTDAAKYVSGTPTLVKACCQGKSKTLKKKYVARYKGDDFLKFTPTKRTAGFLSDKTVKVTNITTGQIEYFQNSTQAGLKFGLSRDRTIEYISKKKKRNNKYIFNYVPSYIVTNKITEEKTELYSRAHLCRLSGLTWEEFQVLDSEGVFENDDFLINKFNYI